MIDAQGLRAVYHKEFPEWVRLPALVDADLLCLPVNWREEKRGINFPKGEGIIDPSPICSIGYFWPISVGRDRQKTATSGPSVFLKRRL
jgi:hypothetical protein